MPFSVTCVEPAWADGPYGTIAWGGSLNASPGGSIPNAPPFDVYCVGPCGPMSAFSTYDEVDLVGDPSGSPHFYNDPTTEDFVVASGGITTPYCAHVDILTSVPATFTIEVTFKITDMPADFLDIPNRHIFIGAASEAGCCAGLFFSAGGISYTGSVTFGAGFGGFGLKLNTPVQLLPNSIGLVSPDVYYTLRIAVDSVAETAYIYLTETQLIPTIGQQLVYIMPAVLSTSGIAPVPDETVLSAAGTALEPSTVQFAETCMATGLLVPNLPPVALPGNDQTARLCSIVRLDGRASFDPEGAPLSYKWRLIGAPDPSMFVFNGEDGATFSMFETNKFYSVEAAAYNAITPIQAGDVLSVGGQPYNITTTGTDMSHGFYIQIDGFDLAGNLAATSFAILKQNGISEATTAQPTFYPDVVGVFTFDLIVFDGSLFSSPSQVVVDVLATHVPRGITPDLTFLWSYLSDFWRLVTNTEVIDVFWGALAQIAAAELLTLWQTEYSKSLRDIQRAFQRRWLHYDLYIQEPLSDLTTVRSLFAGVESVEIPTAGISGVEGTLVITQPYAPPIAVFLSPKDPTHFLPTDIQAQIQRQLPTGFSVQLYQNAVTSKWRVLITAAVPFALDASSTSTGLFTIPSANDLPHGTAGTVIAANTYLVEKTLRYAGVQPGDFLVVDGIAYQIQQVTTAAVDPFASQRIITSDPLPASMELNWTIAGATKSAFLDFYNALVAPGDTAVYEVVDLATNAIAYVEEAVLSAGLNGGLLTSELAITPFTAFPTQFNVFFYGVYRRTYFPLDPLVQDIPTLQELVVNTDDTAVLRENIDFFIESFRNQPCIRFVTSTTGGLDVWQGGLPSQRMWAEVTYIDNRPVIEQNFGILAGFTLGDLSQLPSNTDYLSVVRGLWYAYFNGPTLFDLRVGTQILLGLPFAEENGTITELDPKWSPSQGRILVTDSTNSGIVRSYTYPGALSLEVNPATNRPYAVGDTVVQFAPLVTGAEVVDYIKDPKWFQGYLEQGSFYEVEKFFKFLVRVESPAFSLATLSYVQSFILKIKPTYTYPVFVVRVQLPDLGTTVDVSDEINYAGVLIINTWPCNYAEAGLGGTGLTKIGGSFDDPRSAGGGWWSQFDSDYPLSAPPTYPVAQVPIHWGYDREYLCPEDVIIGTITTTWGGGDPTFDGIWSFDLPVMSSDQGSVKAGEASILSFLALPKKNQVGPDQLATANFSMADVIIEYRASTDELNTLNLGWEIQVFTDSTFTSMIHDITGTYTVPVGADGYIQWQAVPGGPFSITTGMGIRIFVYSAGASPVLPTTPARVFFHFGTAVPWAYDTSFPAGDYEKVRGM